MLPCYTTKNVHHFFYLFNCMNFFRKIFSYILSRLLRKYNHMLDQINSPKQVKYLLGYKTSNKKFGLKRVQCHLLRDVIVGLHLGRTE